MRSSQTRLALRLAVLVGATALVTTLGGVASAAPGVTPPVVDKAANPGTSFTVDKLVTTPEIPPRPDIVLAVDTTGSMGGAIANVQANLHEVITDVKAAQPDMHGAVVSYKDFGEPGTFTVVQNLTPDEPSLQAAVNSLSAAGGGDTPEAWINALFEVSTGAITFRPDSSRIVVLIGDASSHDPSGGHTLADSIAALQATGIRVIAVDVDTPSGDGLNGSGNQATAVVGATGGQLVPSDPDAVTAAILAGLKNLPVTVKPEVVSCDAGLSVGFDKGEVTVPSGETVSYLETVNVAGDAAQGTVLHCTVRFLLNGSPGGDAFTQAVNVTVKDVTPPVVVVDDMTVEATSPAGAIINYPATATDNVDGPLTPVCVPPPGSTFPIGATTVTCTATDAAGNVGSDTATMTVVDTTPPSVGCQLGPNPSGKIVPAPEAGFRTLTGTDIADPNVDLYIKDTASAAVFGPYPSGTNIKLTQAPGATPSVTPGSGAVNWNVKLKGDMRLVGVDNAGNTAEVICRVPPPPK